MGVSSISQRAKLGKADLAELYTRHEAGALRLAYLLTRDPHLAQDIVQDAFVRAFGRLGHLRHADAFNSYLRNIVINLTRDHFRHREVERLAVERETSFDHSAPPPAEQMDERDAMWGAMLSLPHRQRTVLVLRYYEDLTEAQTAEVLDCSISAVKSLASRAMKSLRTTMEGPHDL